MTKEIKYCLVCGKDFVTTTGAKYCSKECRDKGRWIQRQKTHPGKQIRAPQQFKSKICVRCGKEFVPHSGVQKYCDDCLWRTCIVCGKRFKVSTASEAAQTCSKKCQKILTSRTNHEKYGGASPMSSAEVQKRHRKSMKNNRGVEFALQSSEIKEKQHQTMIRRYGGYTLESQSLLKDKRNQTMIDRYGAPYTWQSSILRTKIAETNLIRYGVANPQQSKEIKKKTIAATLVKYGETNFMKTKAGREMLKNDWNLHHDERVIAIREGIKNKYGVNNVMLIPEIQKKASINRAKSVYINANSVDNYEPISNVNKQVADMMKQFGMEVEFEFPVGTRNYDFNIKGTNILIEVDPTFTHATCNEKIRTMKNGVIVDYKKSWPKGVISIPRDSQLKKTLNAEENGYRCVHIFQWDNVTKIFDMLKKTQTIYARKCSILTVDKKTADAFTDLYHIQGKTKGQEINIGLYYQCELVEIMTFGKPRYNKHYDYELLRLCTKSGVTVVGGASKLFTYATRKLKLDNIISYCDRAKFNGNVYNQIGMKLKQISEPQEIWSRGQKFITANTLRWRGFDKLVGEKEGKVFGLGTSNEQLMLDDGWLPVFDCGQYVFEWHNT